MVPEAVLAIRKFLLPRLIGLLGDKAHPGLQGHYSRLEHIWNANWFSKTVGIYYFHIRDERGLVEDPDGIELSDMDALLREVVRSANELACDATAHPGIRFEITDVNGRTVLVAPVQESMAYWELMTRLSAEQQAAH